MPSLPWQNNHPLLEWRKHQGFRSVLWQTWPSNLSTSEYPHHQLSCWEFSFDCEEEMRRQAQLRARLKQLNIWWSMSRNIQISGGQIPMCFIRDAEVRYRLWGQQTMYKLQRWEKNQRTGSFLWQAWPSNVPTFEYPHHQLSCWEFSCDCEEQMQQPSQLRVGFK